MCSKGFQIAASLHKHRKKVHSIHIVEMENEGGHIYMSLGFHLGSRVVFTLVIKNRLVIEKRSKPDLRITRFSRSVSCQLFTIQ